MEKDKNQLEQLEGLPLPAATVTRPTLPRWKQALLSIALLGLTYQFLTSYLSSPTPSNHGDWRAHRSIQGYLSHALSSTLAARPCPYHKVISPAKAEAAFLTIPSPESARNASHSFTAVAHIAGTEGDRLSALRVKSQWEELLGLPLSGDDNVLEAGTSESREALMGKSCGKGHGKAHKWWKRVIRRVPGAKRWLRRMRSSYEKPRVWVDSYYPLLNYPTTHSLTLTPPGASSPSFIAKLLEDDVPEDKTSAKGRFEVPTFHGLSKNGTAKGQLVYAGRGTKAEFIALQAQGIDFHGKIAIVQYGGSFRGLKVSAAAAVGAIGVLIYTDPIEDGEMTTEAGHLPYPSGPARQPSSVQRGSTQFLSVYPGDPLTPGTPAYKNSTSRLPRDDPTINIPSIPSLPISYEDALPLLKSLNGKGIKMGSEGRKEGGLGWLGVEYWTGPGEDEVEMVNGMEDKVTAIWNTMAVIPGRIKDEIVVVGNHNDAWTFGAGDPNSGTASVHEIVKGFGMLLEQGWKPLRTIVLASWDAEEYGLIGSTEFGEDFSAWLKDNVVAYLNVDVAVAGTGYTVGASPSLADLFKAVSNEITDPDQIDRSLLDKMVAEGSAEDDVVEKEASNELYIGPLGSGSDFTVFLQHLGIASANLGYSRKRTDPVYHYHSIYDSADWMDTFGDSTFERHVVVAKVLGLATLRLADSMILPINVTAYAQELSYYATKVHSLSLAESHPVDLSALDAAITKVQKAASNLDKEISDVKLALTDGGHHGRHGRHGKEKRTREALKKVRSINKRLSSFEGSLIDEEGLPTRGWYKNLVVAPGLDLGYGATTFPGLTEAFTLHHNSTEAGIEAERIVAVLRTAAKGLKD